MGSGVSMGRQAGRRPMKIGRTVGVENLWRHKEQGEKKKEKEEIVEARGGSCCLGERREK